MRLYGLAGYPLGHSFSGRYFGEKFAREGIDDCEYRLFPLKDIADLPELLRENPDLRGLNVTIPHKRSVIPLLDEMDPEAARVGAVNCVRIEGGRLKGYNTDVYGFRVSLLELIGQERPRALILGSGGASKAVEYALSGLGVAHRTVSREASADKLAYGQLTREIIDGHKLIVNATPLGTYPDTGTAPEIPYELLTAGHYLYDLVYNPPLPRFLELGARQGARTVNGKRMLALQAERSWEIWNEIRG